MRARFKPFVMISSEKFNLDIRVNTSRTNQLRQHLLNYGLKHHIATGVSDGYKENSFLVYLKDENTLGDLKRIARQYNQESILHVDVDGLGQLLNTDSTGKDSPKHILKGIRIDTMNYSKDFTEVPALGMRFSLGRSI